MLIIHYYERMNEWMNVANSGTSSSAAALKSLEWIVWSDWLQINPKHTERKYFYQHRLYIPCFEVVRNSMREIEHKNMPLVTNHSLCLCFSLKINGPNGGSFFFFWICFVFHLLLIKNHIDNSNRYWNSTLHSGCIFI